MTKQQAGGIETAIARDDAAGGVRRRGSRSRTCACS